MGSRHGKTKNGDPLNETAILAASSRLGVALMTTGTLLALVAQSRHSDPAAAEAAMRELEGRLRERD